MASDTQTGTSVVRQQSGTRPDAKDSDEPRTTSSKGWRREFLWIMGVSVFATVAAAVVLQVWNRDLSTSLSYEWDGLWHQMIVQSTLDNAWVFGTDRLGAPGGQVLLDFPLTDHIQYAYYAIIA
ncbi:MAG: hypothetical protein ACR2N7_04665, partial [Acidimicrobiia bacterium]